MDVKKKKKWKRCVHQITLACLLVCCVVQWMPKKTFASSFVSMDVSKLDDNGNVIVTDGYNEHSVYQMQLIDISKYKTFVLYRPYIKDKNNFAYLMYVVTPDNGSFKCTCLVDNGKTYNFDPTSCGVFNGLDGKRYHVYFFYGFQGGHYKCKSSVTATYDLTDAIIEKYRAEYDRIAVEYGKRLYSCCDDDLINNAMCWDSGDTDELENEASKGALDNPIEDADIGCPVITRKITRDLSGVDSGNSGVGGSLHVGETQVGDNIYYDNGGVENGGNGFYTSFTWKNSTTTGFSLNKNKYAQTFLQVRIQNRSVIYSNLKHTKVKRKLNSYGENAMVYDSWAVSKKPLYFNLSSKTFLKKYLPKYYEEINSPVNLTNALFLGNKYAFQFRIICTDDLSVIPGSGVSSKWHCGRWTEVTANCDVLEDDDPYQKTGDIDSNGDFNQKEDDTTTKIDDSSSGQADNMDDFKDSAENGTKKGLDTSGFEWDDFKNLINECKQVPALIKSIFSFLPDWVLVFVAVGFGIWIFVLIKRAIV